MISKYVLDTNIISDLLRKDSLLSSHFEGILNDPDTNFLGCPMVYYEVKRGLLNVQASRKLDQLERFFELFLWEDYTRADWDLAAELWRLRRAGGAPIADADLMIGVFARVRNATLVTRNTKDFEGLGVALLDWHQ